MSGIISNGYALFLFSLGQNIVCQTLCRFADGINIHTIGTGADNAAQTCGTKFKVFIKTFFDLVVIICDCF